MRFRSPGCREFLRALFTTPRAPRLQSIGFVLVVIALAALFLVAAGGCAQVREGVDGYRATHQPVVSVSVTGGKLCLCIGIEKVGELADIETRESPKPPEPTLNRHEL
jgi:hypothetical protein